MKEEKNLSVETLARAVRAYSLISAEVQTNEIPPGAVPPVKAAQLFTQPYAAVPAQKMPRRLARYVAIAASVIMIAGVLGAALWFLREREGVLDPTDAPSGMPTERVTPAPTVSPVSSESGAPSESPVPTLEIGPLIELDWPEYPVPEYRPEVKVFPLTNEAQIYSTDIVGAETFVDETLTPIDLPFEVFRHYSVGGFNWSSPDDSPKAYTLIPAGEEWLRHVLMFTDGTVPLDAQGQYIILPTLDYADNPTYISIGTSVVTCTEEVVDRTPVVRYGLYDLEERRELLPPVYDSIWRQDGLYFAERGGRGYLLDSKGRVIYDALPTDTPEKAVFESRGYYLDVKNRLLYNAEEHRGLLYEHLEKWNSYFLCISDYDTDQSGFMLYITDADGHVLETFAFRNRLFDPFTPEDDLLLFACDDGFITFDASGTLRRYPADLSSGEFMFVRAFDREIRYTVPYDGYDETVFVNEAGERRPGERDECVPYSQFWDTGIFVRQIPPSGYQLRDKNGNVLLETSRNLCRIGDLVLSSEYYETQTGSRPCSVYAADGTLLADEVYGYIDEQLGPNGGLFVYLDPETCVLIFPDGTRVPVEAAPVVESRYQGG